MILLLELFVFLVDRCEGGSAEGGIDTQSAGPASINIRRMMVNLNDSPGGSNNEFNYEVDSAPPEGMLQEEFESHEGSIVGDLMTESFHLNPDQENGRDEVEEELTSLRISQGGPDDDPIAEFEVGQQFENKEEVLMAVKTYSIRRAVQFKILESVQLKYVVRCYEFGKGCEWNIRVSYRRKQEKLEVRDTIVLIHVCKHQWGKITKGWTRSYMVELINEPYDGDPTSVMFKRVFWTFPPCVEAFKHCKYSYQLMALICMVNMEVHCSWRSPKMGIQTYCLLPLH
ncbi:hypothetical protein PIB30_085487 [Stylosanthes scabra]|uniref:Transposase MuDR plant domain-containing protein n=1 Tax=Stylosanthes scabra TaxID=79078 RepID=A0ABU6YT65_9FABA|nr:hypothetical protein [Stylosanthes scabra]